MTSRSHPPQLVEGEVAAVAVPLGDAVELPGQHVQLAGQGRAGDQLLRLVDALGECIAVVA